jgi:phosphoribosylanthranilate isomerase
MVSVKICGITNLEDAWAAVEAGADALGFVFYPPSPRHVTPTQARAIIAALPPFVTTVGLFVDAAAEQIEAIAARCGLDRLQLHGHEAPELCARLTRPVIKAFRIRNADSLASLPRYKVAAYLLDAYVEGALPGGTGASFAWELAAQAKPYGPVILAGGLTPDNVEAAIRRIQPYGVDVSSGVERAPGLKDHAKLRAFVARAKGLGGTPEARGQPASDRLDGRRP